MEYKYNKTVEATFRDLSKKKKFFKGTNRLSATSGFL